MQERELTQVEARLLGMREPIHVRWYTPDTVRAVTEREKALEDARAQYMSSKRDQYIWPTFESYLADKPIPVGEYTTLHTGVLLEVAYQQESWAVSAGNGSRHNIEHHTKGRWIALVLEHGNGKIVEVDPLILEH